MDTVEQLEPWSSGEHIDEITRIIGDNTLTDDMCLEKIITYVQDNFLTES